MDRDWADCDDRTTASGFARLELPVDSALSRPTLRTVDLQLLRERFGCLGRAREDGASRRSTSATADSIAKCDAGHGIDDDLMCIMQGGLRRSTAVGVRSKLTQYFARERHG
jgi:hypothetical protein